MASNHSEVSVQLFHQQRYHAFDALRVTIMLVVVACHSALNYIVTPLTFYPRKDPSTSTIIESLFHAIQSFKIMPVFFVLAGFFGALLYVRNGRYAMLKNRFKHLLLPFIVFWILLFLSGLLVFLVKKHVLLYGTWGIDKALLNVQFQNLVSVQGINSLRTGHLWFLYYLIILYILLVPVMFLLDYCPNISHMLDKLFVVLLEQPLGIFVLCVPVFIVGLGFPEGVVTINMSFIPALNQIVFYGIFFVAGWYLYKNQHILNVYQRHWFIYAVLAVFCSIAARYCVVSTGGIHHILYLGAFANMATWLTVFALIGGYMRFFLHDSAVFRYLADASFWVYLVHFRFVLLFAGLLQAYSWPAEIKCLLVIVFTLTACFSSYHYCVRRTCIGRFLHGKVNA
jgi:glucan biosynthesis protein C